MRLQDVEIHVIADNDAVLTAIDLSASSAINGATGELVAAGHANSVKVAASGVASHPLVRAAAFLFINPG